MTSQLRWPVLVTALLAVALTGCAAPLPPPGPTPGFTSETEAFAAAEKTYRAYVDALNEVDLSDPETFEAVYAWTTGEANAGARKSLTGMSANGWRVEGDSRFDGFNPLSIVGDGQATQVVAELCLDVSLVDVFDDEGRSQVPEGRVDRQPATVTFSTGGTSTGLTVAASTAMESDQCD